MSQFEDGGLLPGSEGIGSEDDQVGYEILTTFFKTLSKREDGPKVRERNGVCATAWSVLKE